MALASEPVLLLMDEPTAGMSPEETKVMMDLIVALAAERSVILVEHKMKLVMGICQRLAGAAPRRVPGRRHARRHPRQRRGAARLPGTRLNPMLKVQELNVWYERSHVVQGVDLEVRRGEIVTLMGRNGAGKTSTLKAIMGLLAKRGGSVRFDGQEILAQPAHTRYHAGLAYVPEERRIVPGLSVHDNLRLGLIAGPDRHLEAERIAEIAQTFPRLAERMKQDGTSLSGGEQQMLAIARAMMSKPRMILLDEPSEGIMPLLVHEMFNLFSA
jgi:branched-chain amino acid transport system ATP-binding protein